MVASKPVARALRSDDWPHVERLFGARGACGGCWCMLWRAPYGGKRFDADKGEPNRLALKRLVESGQARGVLAFAGAEPVGWSRPDATDGVSRSPRGGVAAGVSRGEPAHRDERLDIDRGAEPVGWLSSGPKSDFPYFARSRVLRARPDDATWAVTCIYVPAKWRGQGVATTLLEAAVKLARDAGAPALEGYPVEPKGSGKVPAAFAWTGVPALFEAAGFRADESGPRVVYRRNFRR